MKESMQRNEAPLEKTEAIRRAVEALGYQAPVSEILEYMQARFGIGTADEAGKGSGPVLVAIGGGDAPPPPGKRGKNLPNK